MRESGSIRIAIPSKAEYIINTIIDAGYEAYVVGGCVRDSILGKVPGDWEITTSATPNQVKALFPRTIDTGIQHGTVTVMMDKEGFEVTTYRIDGKYEDSRHPKEVTFTPCLEEDLRRRDFTINAMAYNERNGLVDIFGGMEDIDRGIIRCVGNAEERFGEDALRIMRAIRFSAQLGYRIEDNTKTAIKKLAPTLRAISAERIRVELEKLLCSPHPDYIRDAYEMGITKVILPEFDVCMETPQKHPHHQYNVGEHILHTLNHVKADRVLRLAMFFHDIGKPGMLSVDEEGIHHFYNHPEESERITRSILRRLRYDNDTIAKVCQLVYYHDYCNGVVPNERLVRRALHRVGEEMFPYLFPVMRADVLGQSDYMRQEKLDNIDLWESVYEKVKAAGQCVSLKTLAVTGKDLMAMGIPEGPKLGQTLNELLELVLEHPEWNEKERLLEELQKR